MDPRNYISRMILRTSRRSDSLGLSDSPLPLRLRQGDLLVEHRLRRVVPVSGGGVAVGLFAFALLSLLGPPSAFGCILAVFMDCAKISRMSESGKWVV